jgi:phospholipid transport system substrate-binding protein
MEVVSMKTVSRTAATAAILGILILVPVTRAVPEAGPMAEVKAAVDRVVAILSQPDADCPDPFREKLERVVKVVENNFADQEMVRRTAGAHWKKLNPEERKELTGLFTKLLWRSYMGRLKLFENQKITYSKELIDGDYAQVESLIAHRGEMIPLDYRLKRLDGRWMIYDMIIDGMSLVANYRRQFNKIINREGYPGLVSRLKKKLDEVEKQDPLSCEPPQLDKG